MMHETYTLSSIRAGLIESQVINKAEHKKNCNPLIVSCLQDDTHPALPGK